MVKRFRNRKTATGGLIAAVLALFAAAAGIILSVNVSPDGSIKITLPPEPDIQVEVAGEVANPGVYPFAGGTGRVGDLLVAAGGTTEFADLSGINRAALLEDGQRIDVPRRCFNINTISAEEFDLFPGIGPARADDIVSHRRSAGDFKAVEDLTAVRGIGDATLARIQEAVCLVTE